MGDRDLGRLPIVTFDTSAHNRLVDDCMLAEPVLGKIKSEMFFRFAGLSIEELYATKDATRRSALLASCRRLQEGKTDCLYPQDELLKLLIGAHARKLIAFDWLAVDVRSGELAEEITAGELINDEELIAEHRKAHFAVLKQYKLLFAQSRPMLQTAFENHGEARPFTFRDFLVFMENSDEKLMAGFAKSLYDRVAGTDVSKDFILALLDICPPFRAFNYALHLSNFDLAVRDEDGDKFESGRNDLFMAIYLPYCDHFVTAEKNGEQEKCLREITSVAGLRTEIISYDEFRTSLD
jgi:hypothetical protein